MARRRVPVENHWGADVTEIIPINEFGAIGSDAGGRNVFATDIDVLSAPELDDLLDLIDEQPQLLRAPAPAARAAPLSRQGTVCGTPRQGEGVASRRPGRHRAGPATHRRAPDGSGSTHSRLIIASIAAGAVAAGANAMVDTSEGQTDGILLADSAAVQVDSSSVTPGMQIVQVRSNVDSAVHAEELARGTAFAQERAQREARLSRPRFAFPTQGILTSGFGARWGTLHAGLDIANAIGTPIYAASDGDVIASGPTPGFGMWVKIRSADGTVTLYGHVDTTTVQVGQRVMAGDQIATMGNRGNSTGPHLHFEVHLNSAEKIDPMWWLSERGVRGQ